MSRNRFVAVLSTLVLVVVACLMLGCGPEPTGEECGGPPECKSETVGARIGNLTMVCLTEQIPTDAGMWWRYGVCVDPACLMFQWIYSDADGHYMREDAPAYADTRCRRPGAP
jgi:hypothetical protein